MVTREVFNQECQQLGALLILSPQKVSDTKTLGERLTCQTQVKLKLTQLWQRP